MLINEGMFNNLENALVENGTIERFEKENAK